MDATSCDHLIIWLNTFDGIEGAHHSAEDLSDGLAMAEALTQIAPEWFDNDWISKIMQDISSDNHRLKMKAMITWHECLSVNTTLNAEAR